MITKKFQSLTNLNGLYGKEMVLDVRSAVCKKTFPLTILNPNQMVGIYQKVIYKPCVGVVILQRVSMANPALKNGYLSIATELVEKLATLSIPSSEMRLVWVLWRKTWGWAEGTRKKDWDWISLSQFSKLTTIKKSNIPKLLKSLVYKRIILKRENGYKFNQNYDEWVVYKRITPVCKRITPVIQTHYQKVIQTHANNRKKETITKDITREQVAQEEIFNQDAFLQWILDNDKQRHIRLIARFLIERRKRYKTPDFTSKEQVYATIPRYVRVAKKIETFGGEQISKAVDKAFEKVGDETTLETIYKYLTK